MSILTTAIAGVSFPGYVMNAAVPASISLEGAQEIGESDAAAILIKSVTLAAREGNPEPRYSELPFGSINSIGLANGGLEHYLPFAAELKSYNKPIFVSVSGFSLEEYEQLIMGFAATPVDFIEVNLSCPNVPDKPIVGYDPDQVAGVLQLISKLNHGKKIGVKLPPYPDNVMLLKIAELLKAHPVDFITCTNTLGNSLYIDVDNETPVMKAGNGFGGLAGPYIKPIALGNVRRFYDALGDSVAIIGAGGIETGLDAFEFLLAGASLVQVGTAFYDLGTSVFSQINEELAAILEEKGYADIAAARGQLKFL